MSMLYQLRITTAERLRLSVVLQQTPKVDMLLSVIYHGIALHLVVVALKNLTSAPAPPVKFQNRASFQKFKHDFEFMKLQQQQPQ
jgi:hypothetical protein